MKYSFKISYCVYWSLLLVLINAMPAIAQQRITGRVLCEGKPLKGVVVSSGTATVRTDALGQYTLFPDAGQQFVQISTPAGYITERDTTIPRFYQQLKSGVSRYDFKLLRNPVDDDHHVFFAQADVQVTSREELATYRKEVVSDMRSHLSLFKGRDVFGVDLGDMVGDMPDLFPEYITSMSPLNIPFYRAIGNHDMSYWGRSFETSERTFNNHFGPTVYSFNKGKAHYIVLNNNFYVGRDYFYMGYVDEKTMRWLEKDLSFVPKGTLVFVMLHIPTRLQKEQQPFAYDYSTIADQTVNASAFHHLLEGYDTHILSGHMHYNLNIQFNDSLFEHNTAAVCGTWWRAQVCLDGTPRGYAVYEVKGKELSWYYKSAGLGKDHQFRTYTDTTNGQHRIIANVWNYDDKWKVEWLENGKPMGTMERYKGHDPLAYQLCQDRERMKYDWIQPIETGHLFKAIPVNKNASIQVRVTDRFGRVYLEDVKTDK